MALADWADFLRTFWLAGVALLCRHLLNVNQKSYQHEQQIESSSKLTRCRRAKDVLDALFGVVEYALLEALGFYVILRHNAGCSPWHFETCLAGGPHPSIHALQRWYMVLSFHHLLHECVGSHIGLGAKLKADMTLHHIVVMGFLLITHGLGYQRYIIMLQTLYCTTAPFTHAYKALHAAGLPKLAQLKWACSSLAALFFFIGRIALAPTTVFPVYTAAFKTLSLPLALLNATLLSVVLALQCFWCYVVVRRLVRKVPLPSPREAVKASKAHLPGLMAVRGKGL